MSVRAQALVVEVVEVEVLAQEVGKREWRMQRCASNQWMRQKRYLRTQVLVKTEGRTLELQPGGLDCRCIPRHSDQHVS